MHATLFDETGTVECSVVYNTQETATTKTTTMAPEADADMAVDMPTRTTAAAAAAGEITTESTAVKGKQNEEMYQEESEDPATSVIIGGSASQMEQLRDVDDKLGFFFCFPNIRVRYPGRYRLRFSLFPLPRTEEPNVVIKQVFSEVFTVYSAKDFPGRDVSTKLSRKLAAQGVSIPIRNKSRLKMQEASDTLDD
ncbi:hypothetical protein GGI25_001457 [Coemansia spiralis]|uniref:Velvet domain-containing protein n=1 Tax=Coemansia spiralis TaxID=417178 RepID=A0A9W8KYG3_9FUNG|nr:hypothetical protein GGI25_001457 [Coemansia spiralis]